MRNFSHKSENLWMINFTDLTMLLIAFFLLIYASSNVKKIEKPEELTTKSQKTKVFSGKTEDLNYLYVTIKDSLPQEISLIKEPHKLIFRAKLLDILDNSFSLSNSGKNFFSLLSLHLADIENNVSAYYSVVIAKNKANFLEETYIFLQKSFQIATLLKSEVKSKIAFFMSVNSLEEGKDKEEYLELIINDY